MTSEWKPGDRPTSWWGRQTPTFQTVLILAIVGVGIIAYLGRDSGTAPSPRPQPASRCVAVTGTLVNALADGLTVQGGGTLGRLRAVRSDDFEAVHFVAGEIDGPGMEGAGQIGVWAVSGSLSDFGLIMSVNAMAEEFSVWPYGPDTQAGIRMSDDGAREAERCVS